eukprot:TRINITY_DN8261_c0_g1_i5.p1 TRINITY_DN8261_c0_g1~~TRINITY_DN8261_c0_g1_i5.p1  ORF type:complete len:310 (+),score=73.64 TRINITY_DN8261_c0_g1_i5:101-1030(+)
MYRRPQRSTLSSSSAASDVYKRQVHACHFLEVGTSALRIRLQTVFHAATRTDARSGLALAGLLKRPAGEQIIQARGIRLPVVFDMLFDGGRCSELCLGYRVSVLFAQLAQQPPPVLPSPPSGASLLLQRTAAAEALMDAVLPSTTPHDLRLCAPWLCADVAVLDHFMMTIRALLAGSSTVAHSQDCASHMHAEGAEATLEYLRLLQAWFRTFCTLESREAVANTLGDGDRLRLRCNVRVSLRQRVEQSMEVSVVLSFGRGVAQIADVHVRHSRSSELLDGLGAGRRCGDLDALLRGELDVHGVAAEGAR